MTWLRRLSRRVVPVYWREIIDRDLGAEARERSLTGIRGEFWIALQLIRIGVSFRLRLAGDGRRLTRAAAFDRLRVDIRHAWSSLRARPGATLGAVLILTVGIGFATTVFALVDPFLLRPLPYRNPERLAVLHLVPTEGATVFERDVNADLPTLAEWRQRVDLFEDIAAYGPGLTRLRVSSSAGGAQLWVWPVSANFLALLGASTNWLGLDDAVDGSGPLRVSVTSSLAHARLGFPANARYGTVTKDDGSTIDVSATLPTGFVFPTSSLVRRDGVLVADYGTVAWAEGAVRQTLTAVARLRPGVSPTDVKRALDGRLASSKLQLRVVALHDELTMTTRPLAMGGLAAALLIVVVCTANVMNLVVARGIYRARDFATRQALGASRLDLLQLHVLELAGIGAAATLASLLVAGLALPSLVGTIPAAYVALGVPLVSLRVALFALGLTTAVVAVCAAPGWFSSRSIGPANAARVGESRYVRRSRFVLAACQTAIAMMLVLGATFLARSYANLWMQDTGFSREARLVTVFYPASRSKAQMLDATSRALAALRRVPGVTAVAAGTGVGPLIDAMAGMGGPAVRAGNVNAMIIPSQISPGYFDVIGTPIAAGRALTDRDRGWEAVIVNERFARRAWPSLSLSQVVGQPLVGNGQPGRIVGVVRDARDRALDLAPPVHIYKPFDVGVDARDVSFGSGGVTFALRLAHDTTDPAAAIRQAILSVDPAAAVDSPTSVYGRLADTVRERTFTTLILGLFGGAGLAVSATGLFAIVAFAAARRTREIAIRLALGASAGHVRGVVIRDALRATTTGTGIGMAAGHWLVRALESRLYGVGPNDVVTHLGAAAGFVTIAIVAAWWPTRRALRLHPVEALRVE
jgi:predicted permease